MDAILASANAPRAQLDRGTQPHFRAFLCSALNRTRAHVFLFASPNAFHRQLVSTVGHLPRLHILPSAAQGDALQHSRYEAYLGLLRSHKNFSKVVLADAFDVLFQADVFAELAAPGLYVSEEWPSNYSSARPLWPQCTPLPAR